jgi:hypothetical protein
MYSTKQQIIWAIEMNFKSWDLFKYNFGIKFIIAMYKDWKRKQRGNNNG